MGNHEYCTGCGASDFHRGKSCAQAYPERWAEKEAERMAVRDRHDKERARVANVAHKIVSTLKPEFVHKAIGASILDRRNKIDVIKQEIEDLQRQIDTLKREIKAIGEHCKHPPEHIDNGFLYTSCNLCGALDI